MASIDETDGRQTVTVAESADRGPNRVLDFRGGLDRFSKKWRNRGWELPTLDLPACVNLPKGPDVEANVDLRSWAARESLPARFNREVKSRMIPSFSSEQLGNYGESPFEVLEPGGSSMRRERVWPGLEKARWCGVHNLTASSHGHMSAERKYGWGGTEAWFQSPEVTDVPGTPFQGIIGYNS